MEIAVIVIFSFIATMAVTDTPTDCDAVCAQAGIVETEKAGGEADFPVIEKGYARLETEFPNLGLKTPNH